MYHLVASFDVKPEHRDDFIDAALADGRDSVDSEPGTRRFEVIVDADDPNRFYLNEAYDDAAAFEAHKMGPYLTRFFKAIEDYASKPTEPIKGTRIGGYAK